MAKGDSGLAFLWSCKSIESVGIVAKERPPRVDSHRRSIAKALSWRFFATLITSTVAWIVTDELRFAAAIGLGDTVVKLGAYYMHERLWEGIPFGRPKVPEYEI